ncbi:MAG: hypothetical protein KGH60_01000 [Candidatus Micrarchaeota archaeon]|nr:hypothetical protein [Candidatus Micrarchaeota archaeon]
MVNKVYRTTILIDKDLWRKFRIKALSEGKSASKLLEDIIKRKVGETKG